MAYVHTRCPGGSTTSCLDVYKLYAGDWKKDNGVPTILLEFAHPTLDTQAQEAVLRSLHFSVPVRGRVVCHTTRAQTRTLALVHGLAAAVTRPFGACPPLWQRVTISGKADFKQKKPRPYATLVRHYAIVPCARVPTTWQIYH